MPDDRGMAIHDILKMGDARLLRVAQPVRAFDTDKLHLLVRDMFETMHAANGAGLAAPQIGVDLQLVIFGTGAMNPRYPDAPPVPRTVLCNPVITPLSDEEEEDWEGCLSVPGLRGVVPRWRRIRYSGFDPYGDPIERDAEGFHDATWRNEFGTTDFQQNGSHGCVNMPVDKIAQLYHIVTVGVPVIIY